MCGRQVQYKMADLYAPGRAECRHTSHYPREERRCCHAAADPQLPACTNKIRRGQGGGGRAMEGVLTLLSFLPRQVVRGSESLWTEGVQIESGNKGFPEREREDLATGGLESQRVRQKEWTATEMLSERFWQAVATKRGNVYENRLTGRYFCVYSWPRKAWESLKTRKVEESGVREPTMGTDGR